MKPRVQLVIERADGSRSDVDTGDRVVAPAVMDAAEDLLHTLTTGERPIIRNLYELCAKAFGTTREDAKERLVAAMYGKGGKALP